MSAIQFFELGYYTLPGYALSPQSIFEEAADAQKNLGSGANEHIVIGYQERAIYHDHCETDKRIGIDHVPVGLEINTNKTL